MTNASENRLKDYNTIVSYGSISILFMIVKIIICIHKKKKKVRNETGMEKIFIDMRINR